MSREIDIINVALFKVGGKSIRDFSETGRSRDAEKVYRHYRDLLISMFDWSFARKFASLNVIDENLYRGTMLSYEIPSDCARPIDIEPLGSGQKWEVEANAIWTAKPDPVLRYTITDVNSGNFSASFMEALSCACAVTLAPMIRQSDIRVEGLKEDARLALVMAHDEDASRGSDSIHPDMDPDNDPFVNPGQSYDMIDLPIMWK